MFQPSLWLGGELTTEPQRNPKNLLGLNGRFV
jgi:hypothetical protein